MKLYQYVTIVFTVCSLLIMSLLLTPQIQAQSSWEECNRDTAAYNLARCRNRAEQFKNSKGPHGQPDEAWYSWAQSSPFPLSYDTACGVAPQSVDCRNSGEIPLECPSESEFLFTSAGRLSTGARVSFNGEITAGGGDWRAEKEDSIFVARSDQAPNSPLKIEFAQPVTLQTVFMYDNDTERTSKAWSINGITLQETKDNKWGKVNFNKSADHLYFESGGNAAHFNVCIKKLLIASPTRKPSPTVRPSGEPTPTPPPGGNGRGFLFNSTKETKKVGDSFDVQVIVDTKVEKVFGAEAHVKYDGTILSLSRVQEGNFFPAMLSTNNVGSSSIRGIVAEPADYRTGTGNFATLTFTALQNGVTTVTFYCDQSAYNSSKIVKNDINASNVIECDANNTLTVQVGAGEQITPTITNSEPTRDPTKKPSNSDQAKVLAAIVLLVLVLLVIFVGI